MATLFYHWQIMIVQQFIRRNALQASALLLQLKLIEAAGLSVKGKLDARPIHPKTQDETDALHVALSREVTTLWRLVAAS
jgi:hypothetical protein